MKPPVTDHLSYFRHDLQSCDVENIFINANIEMMRTVKISVIFLFVSQLLEIMKALSGLGPMSKV